MATTVPKKKPSRQLKFDVGWFKSNIFGITEIVQNGAVALCI